MLKSSDDEKCRDLLNMEVWENSLELLNPFDCEKYCDNEKSSESVKKREGVNIDDAVNLLEAVKSLDWVKIFDGVKSFDGVKTYDDVKLLDGVKEAVGGIGVGLQLSFPILFYYFIKVIWSDYIIFFLW